MNCALYARVSTERQLERDLSIPAQLRLMREHAHSQGWVVVAEFLEGGKTGTNANRPALQEMLTQISQKTLVVDVVLCHKLNRFSRSLEDFIPMRAALRRQGVRLSFVTERVDDSPSAQLVENVLASI